jgi:hypothetical protein
MSIGYDKRLQTNFYYRNTIKKAILWEIGWIWKQISSREMCAIKWKIQFDSGMSKYWKGN